MSKEKTKKMNASKVVKLVGSILIIFSLLGFCLVFGKVIFFESEYQVKKVLNVENYVNEASNGEAKEGSNINAKIFKSELAPPNFDFSIVIPKIGASAPVISSVDPFNEGEFTKALRSGVAHAKGTSFPDMQGNVYIFAHSTDAFYNVGRYNAVFYLIGKLEKGDEIYVYYKGTKYTYLVFDKMVVDPNALEYLGVIEPDSSTLTLQTCYPPGTTLKRLIVLSKSEK
jgi:sortase A